LDARLSQEGATTPLNPTEIVITLAEKAASSVDAALTIRRKNRELRRAYHELRESERLKKDLTDMIIHDMRSPLTSIIGSMELISDSLGSRFSDQESQILGIALTSGHALLSMIDDLVDVSRLEERRIVIDRRATRVQSLVLAAVHQVEIQAMRRGLTISADVPEGTPDIAIDRDLISRVLVNLLSNAIHHTPSGGRVSIIASGKPGGSTVEISVRDTGEGIPKEYHRRIFDKFAQVDTGQNRQKRSSGLGLAFCKLATEAHNGTISVDSEPDKGSTFTISIPAA
jgi:signal transduction histidine kinase